MPAPKPRVTTTEIVDWTTRHAAGESIRSIATSTGRAPRTISRHLDGMRYGAHISEERRQTILAMHADGLSVSAIHHATGHAWDTVTRVIAAAEGTAT